MTPLVFCHRTLSLNIVSHVEETHHLCICWVSGGKVGRWRATECFYTTGSHISQRQSQQPEGVKEAKAATTKLRIRAFPAHRSRPRTFSKFVPCLPLIYLWQLNLYDFSISFCQIHNLYDNVLSQRYSWASEKTQWYIYDQIWWRFICDSIEILYENKLSSIKLYFRTIFHDYCSIWEMVMKNWSTRKACSSPQLWNGNIIKMQFNPLITLIKLLDLVIKVIFVFG